MVPAVFFFSKRVNQISSIEHDKNYYEKVSSLNNKLNSNINFYLVEPEIDDIEKVFISRKSIKYKNMSFKNYVLFPLKLKKKYDVIFIDGRCREKCLIIAISLLKDNGLIIFDDTEKKRTRYQKYIDVFSKYADVSRYYGLNICLPYMSETSVIKNINFEEIKKTELYKEVMNEVDL